MITIERDTTPVVGLDGRPNGTGQWNMVVTVKWGEEGNREFTLLSATHALYARARGQTINAIEATDDEIIEAIRERRILRSDGPSYQSAIDRLRERMGPVPADYILPIMLKTSA